MQAGLLGGSELADFTVLCTMPDAWRSDGSPCARVDSKLCMHLRPPSATLQSLGVRSRAMLQRQTMCGF